jgi:hypothetical protein
LTQKEWKDAMPRMGPKISDTKRLPIECRYLEERGIRIYAEEGNDGLWIQVRQTKEKAWQMVSLSFSNDQGDIQFCRKLRPPE